MLVHHPAVEERVLAGTVVSECTTSLSVLIMLYSMLSSGSLVILSKFYCRCRHSLSFLCFFVGSCVLSLCRLMFVVCGQDRAESSLRL